MFAFTTLALVGVVGCNIMGPLLYLLAPRQIRKTEYHLTKSHVAVFVEFVHQEQDNPVFVAAFHEKLTEILRDRKINRDVAPQADIYRLRQQNPDFKSWGLQRIARELEADELIYVCVDNLRLRTVEAVGVMEPSVEVRVKVISTSEPSSSARVFPGSAEQEGRRITRARPAREATDPVTYDDEAGKLGKDLAYLVAQPFYDVDEEEHIPWEQ